MVCRVCDNENEHNCEERVEKMNVVRVVVSLTYSFQHEG